jgi:hypothetical protein
MIGEYGAVDAVRRLIASGTIQSGFVEMWECERLDLTVEALVIGDEFQTLFTQPEIARARRRLEDCGFLDQAG